MNEYHNSIYHWINTIAISNIVISFISIFISLSPEIVTKNSIISFFDLVHSMIIFLIRIIINFVSLILIWNELIYGLRSDNQYAKLYLYVLFLPYILFIWIGVLYKHYDETDTSKDLTDDDRV